MKKKIIVSFLALFLLVSGGVITLAGTQFQNYNTTVGKFNGSGYTAYQTKIHTNTDGHLNSGIVGGNYKVDTRMITSSGSGSSWYRIDDNLSYILSNNVIGSSFVRLQFSNDISTPVDVQVSGDWRSN